MLDAMIIAGNQSIKGMESEGNKALYQLNGKPMIKYLTDSLRQSKYIDRIIIVGPESGFREVYTEFADELVNANEGIIDNIMKGVEYLGYERNILICTADIPLITPDAIDNFIENAEKTAGDFCYPIVDKKLNDEKYPQMQRTYVKIREGSFTGGNLFFINPSIVKTNYEFARKVFLYRKKPLKMSALLGFGFLLKLVLGLVTINAAEKKFKKITGINAKAIISTFPEVGQDVDKAGDVSAAKMYLALRNG